MHQEVHVSVSRINVFGVFRNGNHVIEATSAFFRNHVLELDLVTGFLGTGNRLLQVTRVTHSDTDVAVGQVGDVLGGVEVTHRRTDLQEQGFGFGQLLFVLGVGRVAQVMQGSRDHLGRGIEEADATAFQLGRVLGLEQHVPGVDGVDAQSSLHLFRVVADADGAPHVRERVFVVFVAGIANGLEQRRVEVFPVRQLGLVQLLVNPGLDLLGQEIVGRHDDVVA